MNISMRNPFYKVIKMADTKKEAASYRGIGKKNLWFWLLCLVGIGTFFFIPSSLFNIPILVGASVIVLLCPFLAYWFPTTIPIAGSLYSFMQGTMIAYVCQVYAKEYQGIILLAITITVLIDIVIKSLYSYGIIKVNQKFKGIFISLFLVSTICSSILFISSFFTNTLTNLFWGSGMLSIVFSIISLIIAIISLVFEYDFTMKLVSQGMHKKYEWVAAYGIFMSVIMIFMRTLELLIKIMDKTE